jgi:hypothetical protein
MDFPHSTWDQIFLSNYARQRLHPRPGDHLYLHLSDLLMGLRDIIPLDAESVLDFGCGASPYRTLFGRCTTYHRADLAGREQNLDFEFTPDAQLPEQIGRYDCVLSTQVLEHVHRTHDRLWNGLFFTQDATTWGYKYQRARTSRARRLKSRIRRPVWRHPHPGHSRSGGIRG